MRLTMCVVAICFRCLEGTPIAVGANREEAYARGGTPPAVQPGPIRFVAGLDPTAGGTWLGVNAAGLLIAVTNRKKKHLPPVPRSRGLLVRDLLACRNSVMAVEAATRELASGNYAGCNLICADRNEAFVIEAGGLPRLRPLSPGMHIITTGDLDDLEDRRIRFGLDWFARESPKSLDLLLRLLEGYLSTCDGSTPICLHYGERGTVSSSIVVLSSNPADSRFMHAQGSPDMVPYSDRSELLAEITGSRP